MQDSLFAVKQDSEESPKEAISQETEEGNGENVSENIEETEENSEYSEN